MLIRRQNSTALCLLCVVVCAAFSAFADSATIPVQLQVDLAVKLIDYVDAPSIKSADIVRIGILTKRGSPDSAHAAIELKSVLDRVDKIAGLSHQESVIDWDDASGLANESSQRKLVVLFLTPGLDSDIAAIAQALQGVRLITIAASGSYVPDGAILGFEVVSGHPRMVFNMTQARRQGVAFRSAVMKLMRIVE